MKIPSLLPCAGRSRKPAQFQRSRGPNRGIRMEPSGNPSPPVLLVSFFFKWGAGCLLHDVGHGRRLVLGGWVARAASPRPTRPPPATPYYMGAERSRIGPRLVSTSRASTRANRPAGVPREAATADVGTGRVCRHVARRHAVAAHACEAPEIIRSSSRAVWQSESFLHEAEPPEHETRGRECEANDEPERLLCSIFLHDVLQCFVCRLSETTPSRRPRRSKDSR